MNPSTNYQELALKHLSIMYRTEHQFLIYLQVFAHKAKTRKLQGLLFDLKQSINYKLNFLQQMMKSMKNPYLQASSEGVNGLFKETFNLIENDKNTSRLEATILHSLILASHFKLGNYSTLMFYFRSLDFDKEADLMQKVILAEKAVLSRINTLMMDDFIAAIPDTTLEKDLSNHKY